MKNGGRMEYRGCVICLDTSSFSRQNSSRNRKNHEGKRKAAKESKRPGEDGLPQPWQPPRPVVVTMVRRWWPLARALLPPCPTAFWYMFWFMGFACIGSFWASFSIFFDPLGPQKHLLILWFRLENLNSAKTLKTSKSMYNRRNRRINRITIHFNPLKWRLST